MISNHQPIKQFRGTDNLTRCPECQHEESGGMNYGTVDTPPIAQQIRDNRNGITRRWEAQRCICPKCRFLWDVVTANQVEGESA